MNTENCWGNTASNTTNGMCKIGGIRKIRAPFQDADGVSLSFLGYLSAPFAFTVCPVGAGEWTARMDATPSVY